MGLVVDAKRYYAGWHTRARRYTVETVLRARAVQAARNVRGFCAPSDGVARITADEMRRASVMREARSSTAQRRRE